MSVLSFNNLKVPDDFPSAEFEAVCSKTNGHRAHAAHPMLVGALYGVTYRFNALAEYDEKLRASIKLHGPAPGHPHRYEQERDLFGFFNNGFSTMESFAFAMFSVGAIKAGQLYFPLAKPKYERRVSWRTLRLVYATAFPGDPVNQTLDEIAKDQGFKDFYLARNILTHRAAPPRAHTLPIGSNRPNSTVITRVNISFAAAAISSRRQQVAALLLKGFIAMRQFVTTHP